MIEEGEIALPRPEKDSQMWVRVSDGSKADGLLDLGGDGKWKLVEWSPGQSRKGVWDMGHVPGEEYVKLHRRYMNHEITAKEFLEEYHDVDNYDVQDPGRNRSRVDEVN